MKYSLDFDLRAPNRAILDALVTKIPLITDLKVWGQEYDVSPVAQIGPNREGFLETDWRLTGMVRFITSANRTTVKNALQNYTNVQNLLRAGSWIKYHACTHDGTGGPCGVTGTFTIGTL